MTTHTPTGRPAGRVEPAPSPTCVGASLPTTTVEPLSARPATPRAQTLRSRLSDRDLSVLVSLQTLRLMTGAQIQRLHVGDGSDLTQARRCRALLQRLADLKLVVRLGRRVGGIRAGSSGYIYGLSGTGQAVLGLDGHYGGKRRRVWETSPAFQDHVLAVAEIHVALVEAERAGCVELLAFDAEPAAWRQFPGPHGQAVTLKPDAYACIGVGDMEYSAFIEVDMGTESAPTIARKCEVYAAYWRTGIEQAAHEVFPSVVWLANTDRAADRIAEVVKRLPADARPLFEVALAPDAVAVLTRTAQGGRMA